MHTTAVAGAAIFLLQILSLPIFARDNSSAFGRATSAFEGVVAIIGCRPIVGEFAPSGHIGH